MIVGVLLILTYTHTHPQEATNETRKQREYWKT
jgi:hypothetical protein